MLAIELGLRTTLHERRGDLRVGFYQRVARLDDPAGLLREVATGLELAPWLGNELDLAGASTDLRLLADSLEARPMALGRAIQDTLHRFPRLHAKTQLFLTRPAWRGLLREHRLRTLLAFEVLPTMGLQLQMDSLGLPLGSDSVMEIAAEAAKGLPKDSTAMFLTVGSQNKDTRGMLLDGEIKATVAGPKALIGLLEFIHIMALSRFTESQEELEQLMPPWSEKARSLAYKIHRAL